jgi:methylmalonyl-CoA/ethylmalonyl-CoA epimerase
MAERPDLHLPRLHHVGIAVRDLDEAVDLYQNRLGLTAERIQPPPGSTLQFAIIRLGEVELELLATSVADSTISQFLKRRGPGVHHLALLTHDLRTAQDAAAARGLERLSATPLPGINGTLTCFFHPRSSLGVLFEFVEDPRFDWTSITPVDAKASTPFWRHH